MAKYFWIGKNLTVNSSAMWFRNQSQVKFPIYLRICLMITRSYYYKLQSTNCYQSSAWFFWSFWSIRLGFVMSTWLAVCIALLIERADTSKSDHSCGLRRRIPLIAFHTISGCRHERILQPLKPFIHRFNFFTSSCEIFELNNKWAPRVRTDTSFCGSLRILNGHRKWIHV